MYEIVKFDLKKRSYEEKAASPAYFHLFDDISSDRRALKAAGFRWGRHVWSHNKSSHKAV